MQPKKHNAIRERTGTDSKRLETFHKATTLDTVVKIGAMIGAVVTVRQTAIIDGAVVWSTPIGDVQLQEGPAFGATSTLIFVTRNEWEFPLIHIDATAEMDPTTIANVGLAISRIGHLAEYNDD